MVRYATSFAEVIGSAAIDVCGVFFDDGLTGGPSQQDLPGIMSNGAALLRNPAIAAEGLVFSVISARCVTASLFSLKAVTERPSRYGGVLDVPGHFADHSAPVTSRAGSGEGAALFI